MKKSVIFILQVLLAINSLLFGLSFFGKHHWVLELLSHLRMHFGLTFIILGIILIIFKQKGLIKYISTALGICILFWSNFAHVQLFDIYKGQTSIKLGNINLYSLNKDFEKTIEMIRSENPDIICFQEYNSFWHKKLSEELTDYPYKKEKIQEGHFGIATYSKIEWAKSEIVNFANDMFPSLWIEIESKTKNPIGILNTHIEPPIGLQAHQLRVKHFQKMAQFLKSKTFNYLISGDLNTTPYSYHFINLVEDLSLIDSRNCSLGIGATWPNDLGLIGIPIDHILGTQKIGFVNWKSSGGTGSDHRSVFVEFY